jgi:hypothetical protein
VRAIFTLLTKLELEITIHNIITYYISITYINNKELWTITIKNTRNTKYMYKFLLYYGLQSLGFYQHQLK